MTPNNHPYTPQHPFDVEELLLAKSLDHLSPTEWSFLKQHLGSEQQIRAYQQLLQQTQQVLAVPTQPKLQPRPMLQAQLRQKVQQRQQSLRSGFDQLFIAFIGLFSMRSPLSSSLAVGLLAIAFWVGTDFNQGMLHPADHVQDSLSVYSSMDTAVTICDSNVARKTVPLMPKCKGAFRPDSFVINAIIRQ